MKVIYESVREQLDRVIAEAEKNNRRIAHVEMTRAELDELFLESRRIPGNWDNDDHVCSYLGVRIKVIK